MTNSFGNIFKFTTWGESHGKAIGCVVDGCPANIALRESDIQQDLDLRKPGQSKFTTQRKEGDKIEILSGVFEGRTTGTPISLIIYNEDQKSKDYSDVKNKFRPGHADYTYFSKYGIRDYRGGGRSSARETAMRVAAGAIAKKILAKFNIKVTSYLKAIGNISVKKIDYKEINKNSLFCPDKNIVKTWEELLMKIRKDGNSIGAIVETVAKGVPVGLGEPIYGKLDSDLSCAMMTINAVKGFEIGAGFEAASFSGEENADEMRFENGKVIFSSNNSGGVLGGISSGQDIITRIAIKPTSSILKPRSTIDIDNNNTTVITKGRHDPCVGIRAVPVATAMMACVLADHLLLSGLSPRNF